MNTLVQNLLSQVDDFFYARASAQFRYAARLEKSLALKSLFRKFSALVEPEHFVELHKYVKNFGPVTEANAAQFREARALLAFIAKLQEFAQSSELIESEVSLRETHSISFKGEALALREALHRLPRENDTEARAALNREIDGACLEFQETWARRLDMSLKYARNFGENAMPALLEGIEPLDRIRWKSDAIKFLKDTEDAYAELLKYSLKKLDPNVNANNFPEWHTVFAAAHAHYLNPIFRAEDVYERVRRSVEDMGLSLNAEGRISIDFSKSSERRAGIFVAELHVPNEVRIVARLEPGLAHYASWLRSLGRAQFRAGLPTQANVAERRLGDESLPVAYAGFFQDFLCDEGWSRKYLRASPADARDMARQAAFLRLVNLRRHAARYVYSQVALQNGASPALESAYEDVFTPALKARHSRVRAIYEVDVEEESLRELRGASLASTFFEHAREHFDQDYFRNPATGRWIKSQLNSVHLASADETAKTLGADTLSLAAFVARLKSVIDA